MLRLPADFRLLFVTDMIVRTAYQMAKTPVLPLFAASIGAGQMLVGSIVAVSTVTGMVTKPLFGALSDRWGRRLWLFIGLAVFGGAPFLYGLVTNPDELFWLRLFHGLATAIFGPVTLAMVAEMGREGRAARLGWFDLAREIGYLVAPTLAAWMLTVMAPERVFTAVGLLSCLAFLPACLIRHQDAAVAPAPNARPGIVRQIATGLAHTASRIELWFASALELTVYTVTYGLKAFLPLFAVQEAGFGVLAAGLFFTVQEAAHLATRPIGGWLGDRAGYLPTIAGGMTVLAAALLFLPATSSGYELMAVAALSGIALGLVFPSTVALVGSAVASSHLGLGMGVYGTCKNLGKVAGPLVAGAMLQVAAYATVFQAMAAMMLVAAVGVTLIHRQHQRRAARAVSGG